MACEWSIDRTCLTPLPDLPSSPSQEQQDAYDLALAQHNSAEDLAVAVMWSLSGRQFGLCETTVRPCPSGAFTGSVLPYLLSRDAGHWTDWPCGCIGSCSISGPRVVHLPGPAAEIVEVRLGATPLAGSGYVLEGDALYRVCDNGCAWPSQNLGAPLGEPGTWSVTYLRGIPVPAGVDKLTGLLAKEMMAACTTGKCRLPRNVRTVARQGVSYDVYDPRDMYANGKTGLPEVDLWLAAVNPNHLAEAPSVI